MDQRKLAPLLIGFSFALESLFIEEMAVNLVYITDEEKRKEYRRESQRRIQKMGEGIRDGTEIVVFEVTSVAERFAYYCQCIRLSYDEQDYLKSVLARGWRNA